MPKNKSHSRVSLKDIRETPTNGIYVTHAEIKKMGLYAGVFFLILTILAVFNRKS